MDALSKILVGYLNPTSFQLMGPLTIPCWQTLQIAPRAHLLGSQEAYDSRRVGEQALAQIMDIAARSNNHLCFRIRRGYGDSAWNGQRGGHMTDDSCTSSFNLPLPDKGTRGLRCVKHSPQTLRESSLLSSEGASPSSIHRSESRDS